MRADGLESAGATVVMSGNSDAAGAEAGNDEDDESSDDDPEDSAVGYGGVVRGSTMGYTAEDEKWQMENPEVNATPFVMRARLASGPASARQTSTCAWSVQDQQDLESLRRYLEQQRLSRGE